MIVALALVLAPPQPAPDWEFIGTTSSGLRMFIDRASLRSADGLVEATVRIGSPTSIAGDVVEVTERNQLDCRGRRWRMLEFEAFGADGTVVKRGRPGGAMLPVRQDSMGATIRDAVCARALPTDPVRTPRVP